MELRGIGVGSQAAVGKVFLLATSESVYETRNSERSPDQEASILKTAIATTAETIREEAALADKQSQDIISALLVMLEDPELTRMAEPYLKEGFDAPTALFKALDDLEGLMESDQDFVSRVADLRGVAAKISAWIRGIAAGPEIPSEGSWVIVADDLTPLETSRFGKSVVGVITALGGPTSHTAIICRSLGIPALLSCKNAMELNQDASILVDPQGNRAVPGGDLSLATAAISFIPQSSSPLIKVRANIGNSDDASKAAKTEARGVGLFRTEVLYLSQRKAPTVKEQVEILSSTLKSAPAGKILIRTIDAGSDKPVPFLSFENEQNPALGVRGFRITKEYEQFQRSQLEAIHQAIEATGRDVGVMAPMISTVSEVRQFKDIADQVGISEIGIMIETPAIIPMLTELRGLINFLSIGTNDLSQYLFAADRLNPLLAELNDPWQPALIRSIKTIVEGSNYIGIPAGICGESATNPLLAIVFAGLGVDSVSVAPSSVKEVWRALSSVSKETAQEVANSVLLAETARGAEKAVRDILS